MKKNLILVALGLLLALPGACTCDGGATDSPKPTPEAKKVEAKPEATPEAAPEATEGSEEAAEGAEGTTEGSEEAAEGSEEAAEGSEEAAEGSEENAEGSEENAEGSEENAEGSEENAEGSEENAEGSEETAEGSEETAEATDGDGAEGDGSQGDAEEGSEEATEDDKVEPPEAAENEGAGEPMQIKDPDFPEMEPGEVYVGPPSKTIKGSWKVVLPTEEYLKSLPDGLREGYKAYEGMTLKFDGKNAVLQTKAKKTSLQYKIEGEEGLTLMLAVSGDLTGTMTFTVLDEDTMLFQTLDLPTFVRARRAGK
jgi:hypothetical protein